MRSTDFEGPYSGSPRYQRKTEPSDRNSRFSERYDYWQRDDIDNDGGNINNPDDNEGTKARDSYTLIRLTKSTAEIGANKDGFKDHFKRQTQKKKTGTMFINELWGEAYTKQIAEQNMPIETRIHSETHRIRELFDQDSSPKIQLKRASNGGSESPVNRVKPPSFDTLLKSGIGFTSTKDKDSNNSPTSTLKNLTTSTPRLPKHTQTNKLVISPRQASQGASSSSLMNSRISLPDIKKYDNTNQQSNQKIQLQSPKHVVFGSSPRSVLGIPKSQKASILVKRGESPELLFSNDNNEIGSQNEIIAKIYSSGSLDEALESNIEGRGAGSTVFSPRSNDFEKYYSKSSSRLGESSPQNMDLIRKQNKQENVMFRKAFEELMDVCEKEKQEITQRKKSALVIKKNWGGKNLEMSRFDQVREQLTRNEILLNCKAILQFRRQQAYIK